MVKDIAADRQRHDSADDPLDGIVEEDLKQWVLDLAHPRDYQEQKQHNEATARYLKAAFEALDYETFFQGSYDNVVAMPKNVQSSGWCLVGAHYDSVPATPGADDNASALAAMLALAQLVARQRLRMPVVFVAFNREEDGGLGSREWVREFLPRMPGQVNLALILEMIGYCDPRQETRSLPRFLPVRVPRMANFLAMVGNWKARKALRRIHRLQRCFLPTLPLVSLTSNPLLNLFFPILLRSDHEHFWARGIPAIMFTDTAEFRNPHYHRPSDTPETLDYGFLRKVTGLIYQTIVQQCDRS